MKKHFFTGAFGLGALAILWVGAGFVGANLLALTMTLVIGAAYVFGTFELHQFRQASATLVTALAAIPDQQVDLDEWLSRLHPSLRHAVRWRIEGERVALPGPALTPYLVGLLVMLGMLGTFLGMVVTLNGAAFSLEGSADLQAIRAALAAPIKGLGLAFGTSVAGVASSAMLGLMSAISRRERMQAAQSLDMHIATTLRRFSLPHQRQESYKALQAQAQALPEVVDKLQLMMAQMERLNLQLNERLLASQDRFHSEVKGVYSTLASSVDQSLKDSLRQSAQMAGESIRPVLEVAMTRMAQETSQLHQRVAQTAQTQLDELTARLETTTSTVTHSWTAALDRHERTQASLVQGMGESFTAFVSQFEQGANTLTTTLRDAHTQALAQQALTAQQHQQALTQSWSAMTAALQQEWQQASAQTLAQQQQICVTLAATAQEITQQAHTSANTTLGEITRLMDGTQDWFKARNASEAALAEQHQARMDQMMGLLRSELGTLRDEEAQRGQAAVERLGQLQAALAQHLTTLGTALEEPIKRLIETASEAPRAAADVMGQLRQEMSSSLVRDNALLEERSRIMTTLSTLLDAINHAAAEQRSVIDTLVDSSAAALDRASQQFAGQVSAEADKLDSIAAQITSSAVDVASLSDTFGFAVQSFHDANEKLINNLQRIEGALDKSMTRSDEQLAYYVAQAREIIDLSIMSQKDIMNELRQIPGQASVGGERVN